MYPSSIVLTSYHTSRSGGYNPTIPIEIILSSHPSWLSTNVLITVWVDYREEGSANPENYCQLYYGRYTNGEYKNGYLIG